MSILDKLIERKDLLAYISKRKERLELEKKKEMKEQPKEKREFIRQRFNGRIQELKKLKEIVHNHKIKSKSKETTRYINNIKDKT